MTDNELKMKKAEIDEQIAKLFEQRRSINTELKKNRQEAACGRDLAERMSAALNETERIFPKSGVVACQGVEGAYSQIAAERFFAYPDIMYFTEFEGVFSAVSHGLCEYGVLPVENSTAGSVNKIYDLMMKYEVYIVKSLRLKVDHNLLVRPGCKLEDIKEIYTHEQAATQCAGFIKNLKGVKLNICANTAVAAKTVAESDRKDIAAISSMACADLYGLAALVQSVQDQGNNYTRFICVSKQLQIYPGADRTSIMAILPHKPGSLYNTLGRFSAFGINLVKLESRPIPDRDFEFMFYFDLETSVYSNELVELLQEIKSSCDGFRYLGSYLEIV